MCAPDVKEPEIPEAPKPPPPPEPIVKKVKKVSEARKTSRKKTSTSSLKIGRASTNTGGAASGVNT